MTIEQYFDRFFELCDIHQTYYQTWQILEKEYFAKFGKNRYKNYKSFRSSKVYYFKTKSPTNAGL